MFTDGLIEGRIGPGTERLNGDGLIKLTQGLLTEAPAGGERQARDAGLVDGLVEQVRVLNGGELDDDLAVLALGYPAAGPR